MYGLRRETFYSSVSELTKHQWTNTGRQHVTSPDRSALPEHEAFIIVKL